MLTSTEIQSCSSKAYISSYLNLCIFNGNFSSFFCSFSSSQRLLVLSVVLFSTVSVISFSFNFPLVMYFRLFLVNHLYSPCFRHLMHFQILRIQSIHKLRPSYWECESQKILPNHRYHRYENNSGHILYHAFPKVFPVAKKQCGFQKICSENNHL